VLDRASCFSNLEVIGLLQTRFIPVAIDQAYQRRQQDAEGRFYQKIANQSPRKIGQGTTQGHYVAAPDGESLGYNNNRDPQRVIRLLQEALENYTPSETAIIEKGDPDPRYSPQPPEGGLVVRVRSKVLGGYAPTSNPWERMFQEGIGRDNLWIRADEHAALAKGEFPDSLIQRIARFHLVDNTRGEPPMWRANEIRKSDVSFVKGQARIEGTTHLQTANGQRSFQADWFGFIEVEDGRVTRFDLVVKGQFRGEGQYTRRAPDGEFPLAITFELADGGETADAIPPQGSRGWIDGYLR